MSNIYLQISLICGLWFICVKGLTIPFEELARSYDSTARPRLRGPVIVNVTLLINSLEIDDVRQVLKVNGELQQEWDDIHLRFSSTSNHDNSIGLEGKRGDRIKHHIWLPDLTIADGLNSFETISRDFLRVEADGKMTWTQQVFYEFPCPFHYSDYPLGFQICRLKLQSVGYDVEEVEPRWAGDESVLYRTALVSPRYRIEEVETSSSPVVTLHRAKRQLLVEIELESLTGWAIRHTVLPFVATVVTAYLAFFINVRGITARLVLCCGSLIIAAIFHVSTYKNVPEAPDTMAIEVFTGSCLTFIWIAIAESVAVDLLTNLGAKIPMPHHNSFSADHAEILPQEESRGQVVAMWLDRCFRVLYPAIFLAFNAVYWILYNSNTRNNRLGIRRI